MKMLPLRNQGNRGILLIECLVYLSVTMVVMGLAFAIFYECQTQSVHLRRKTEHMAIALRFGERWRSEVQAATTTPFLELHDRSVSFHVPTAAGEIVYLYDGMNVYRKDAGAERYLLFLESIRKLEFLEEQRTHALEWRMEMELHTFGKQRGLKPIFSFITAWRGEG